MIVVMAMAALAELDRRHCAERLVDQHPVGLGPLDDVDQAFLEAAAIDDQDRCRLHLGDLLGRRLEIVGVGADRHDRHHVDCATGQLRNDITENVRGDHDRGQVVALASVGVIVTARGGESRQSDESQQEAGHSQHHPILQNRNEYRSRVTLPENLCATTQNENRCVLLRMIRANFP